MDNVVSLYFRLALTRFLLNPTVHRGLPREVMLSRQILHPVIFQVFACPYFTFLSLYQMDMVDKSE